MPAPGGIKHGYKGLISKERVAGRSRADQRDRTLHFANHRLILGAHARFDAGADLAYRGGGSIERIGSRAHDVIAAGAAAAFGSQADGEEAGRVTLHRPGQADALGTVPVFRIAEL